MNVTKESVLTLRNCLMHLQTLKKEEPDKSDLLNRQLWNNAYFEVISDLSSTLVDDFGFSEKKLDNLLSEIDTDFNHFETYISGMADYVMSQLETLETEKEENLDEIE